MKLIQNLIVLIMMFSLTSIAAQMKNVRTSTVIVYGNCGMCKATIEKAGNLKNVANVEWNKDTKMATLTYDAKATNQDEILKRIALSGYDSDHYLSPDETYASLPACCQYERVNKASKMNMDESKEIVSDKPNMAAMDHHGELNKLPMKTPIVDQQEVNLLTAVFTSYFELKDALVLTDSKLAASKASNLLIAVNAIKMEELPMEVHMVWMKVMKDINQDVLAISNSKEVEKQRSHFINLSKNIYDLIKVAKYEEPVYYQFCPMANNGEGANWLSKENVVKNPYYGSQMLSCGKVVETIK